MIVEIPDDELLPRDLWRCLVKHRAGWVCEKCGTAPEGKTRSLQAHHVDCDSTNHRLENGRALCSRCHSYLHADLARERREAAVPP